MKYARFGAAFGPLGPDGPYRYNLRRQWTHDTHQRLVCWIGLNPSTANAVEDDATIRKEVKFSIRLGYTGLVKVNLFAFRSTEPKNLYTAVDPVGPFNTRHIIGALSECQSVIIGWGRHGTYMAQDKVVLRLIKEAGFRPICFGYNQNGTPVHPLYQRDDARIGIYQGG